jgi:flagellar motor switch protein FliG
MSNNGDSARKAAIVAILLGPDLAGDVCSRIAEREVRAIANAVFGLRSFGPAEEEAVAAQFLNLVQGTRAFDAVAFSHALLDAVLGSDGAAKAAHAVAEAQALTSLAHADPSLLAAVLEVEQPQTVAHLPAIQAAQVLSSLPLELASDVAIRIARLRPLPRGVLEALAEKLKTTAVPTHESSGGGGVQGLVQILAQAPASSAQSVLQAIARAAPDLADTVRAELFTFEDVVALAPRDLQTVLQNVETSVLALALKGAQEPVRQKVLQNVSQRAGTMLQEELELMGAVRARDVESARRKIAEIGAQLRDAGEVVGSEEKEAMIE